MSRFFAANLGNSEYHTNENFSKLFEESLVKDAKREGEIVKGTIIGMEDDVITIDVGLKAEGRVAAKEFVKNGIMPKMNIGDKVDVFIQAFENRTGRIVLSHERAIRERSWEELEKALASNKPVDGIVFGKVKGGLTVDLQGVVAFLPGSQVDVKPVKDVSYMMGVVQPFMILKMDKEQGNIVVSRRAIIEESRKEARDEMLSTINIGDVLEGVIKNITDYGAFVDLGSLDGLLHVTDISWSRINHPSEVLSLGQKVKVQVIKYDDKTKRISLGMKQLEANPWEGLDKKYPVGQRMKGKVTNVADYGVFIQLEPGIEGLVHVSELSWNKNNINPRKLVKEGDEVEFVILDIDVDKHRISLGMKQCTDDPWEQIIKNSPVGTEVEAKVKKLLIMV
jgi:small subunit ribosomal protein S1